MFFAQQASNVDLSIYLTMVNQILDEDEQGFVEYLQNIIKTAHHLAKGEITHYQVSNDIYDIVNILVKTNSLYFKQIDPKHIDKRVYQTIQSILKTQQENTDLYLM